MQQLDALTLSALAQELHPWLSDAKVSKVQHPSPHEFLITFWGGNASRPKDLNILYIHLHPEAPFCCLLSNAEKQAVVLNRFARPTAICMLLRKQLQGASLRAVKTLPGERVCNFIFENFNELGNKVRLVLSLELMGKHTNMIFYDAVQETILAVAHGVGQGMSSRRELAPGLPYAPPPIPAGKSLPGVHLDLAGFESLLKQRSAEQTVISYLNHQLAGFGRMMLEDTLSDGPSPATLFNRLCALQAGQQLSPAILPGADRFTLLADLQPDFAWQACSSINALMSDYFVQGLIRKRVRQKAQQLTVQLQQQENKRLKRLQELSSISIEQIEAWQATGDRLLSAFSAKELPPAPNLGQTVVCLTRYEDGSEWQILIDPALGWIENAQVYYKRVKKAKARQTMFEAMAQSLETEGQHIAQLQQMVTQADNLADLEALEEELVVAGFAKKTGKLLEENGSGSKKKNVKVNGKSDINDKRMAGVLQLKTSTGSVLLIGKSGRANETLVGPLSKPEDWWFHVHQMPGSHVILKTEANQQAPLDSDLLEAATWAAFYSAARGSVKVPVVYTQIKYVRKIPHSYPGHVNYRQEKTILVHPDPTIASALMDPSV